jgi:SAM-dependent methyltransferase
MPADPRIYDSERLARAYAHDRPAVHPAICRRITALIPARTPFALGLDVGCGGGASTAALLPYVDRAVGIDPSRAMVRHAAARVPAASFSQAVAEALPFPSAAFQLVTAAGSLNYADARAALREVSRVLAAGGYLAVYDFSAGQVATNDPDHGARVAAFLRRFPSPPGYALDLGALPYAPCALDLVTREELVVDVTLSRTAYVEYLLGETRFEAAMAAGADEAGIRALCTSTFESSFGSEPRPVTFRAEVALARKAAAG